MKQINLIKKGFPEFGKSILFLDDKSLDDSIKSCAPGQWCIFLSNNKKALGFVNPFSKLSSTVVVLDDCSFEPTEYLEKKIKKAISRRRLFKSLESGSRLIYGDADFLPGVICDEYKNVIVLQINRAGIDVHREYVRKYISDLCQKKVVIFDRVKDRSIEGLPDFELDELPDKLEIEESGFKYSLHKEQFQKNGYYYDHRVNRSKMENMLGDMNLDLEKGLDLFCYLGSWGLHALRAGVKKMYFVDQANMSENINSTMDLNSYDNERFEFTRSDVFKYLDNCKEKFDVVISDPPAFTKSEKQKKNALLGYDKLHKKIMDCLSDRSILIAASCTRYITHDELDNSVKKAAISTGRKIQLLDIGLQGQDHPMSGLKSRNNYIKYLYYIVEK